MFWFISIYIKMVFCTFSILSILYFTIMYVCSAAPEPQKDLLLQLVSLQKASGCWDLDATLADVFGKTEDELTNQKPAQVRDVMK